MRAPRSWLAQDSIFRSPLPKVHVFLVTILVCGAAYILKSRVDLLLTPGSFPTFFLAVTFSAWYGGIWPALMATVICSVTNLYYFIPPENSWDYQDLTSVISAVLFSLASLMIATLTASLYEARRKAHEFVAQKNAFVASVSHEIRNPIHVILGMTRFLQAGALGKKEQEYVSAIKQSGDALLSQINDILDYSKISAGKLRIEQVDFNLTSEIEETSKLFIQELRQEIRPKGLEYTFDIAPNVPRLMCGDFGRVRQIIWNLLTNAAKFTKSGSIRLRITKLSDDEETVTLRYEVTDTGSGIPKQERAKIFDAFYQGSRGADRSHGGTGLGLSICKMLVESMGGKIGMTSHLGAGSTFWFTIVARYPGSEATLTPATAHLASLSSFGIRALVADDSEMNRRVALGLLNQLGVRSNAVGSGREVLAALKSERYDIVFLDCDMPEMDGFATAREIRKSESRAGGRVPVVAMTAYSSEEVQGKCRSSGMDHFLCKPVSSSELGGVIQALCPMATVKKGNSHPALAQEIAAIFLEEMVLRLGALDQALPLSDWPTIVRTAHQAQSGAGAVGAHELLKLGQDLEAAARAADRVRVTELLSRLKAEFFRIKVDLEHLARVA